MRLVSTPESVQANEVTWLALVEALIAIALTMIVGFGLHSFSYVAMACLTSPLFLLRADQSVDLAWRWYAAFTLWLGSSLRKSEGTRGALLMALLLYVVFPVGVFAIRIISSSFGLVRWPFKSLRSLPANWTRAVLATDFHHVPEPLPESGVRGLDRGGPVHPLFYLYTLDGRRESLSLIAATLPTMALLFFPAWVYRWSIKSSSLVYLPLIWVAWNTWPKGVTVQERLEDIVEDLFERFRRGYAAFVIVSRFFLPFVIFATWQQLTHTLIERFGARLVGLYLFVGWDTPWSIRMWHVGAAVNAAITFGLWFFAHRQLRARRRSKGLGDSQVNTVLAALTFSRGVLGLYLLGVTIWVFTTSIDWSTVRFTFRWWPD